MGSRPRCTVFEAAQPLGRAAAPAAASAGGGSQGSTFVPLPARLLARRRVFGISLPDFDGDFANPPIKRPTPGSCSRWYHPPAVRVK